jgi:hypothetical protein
MRFRILKLILPGVVVYEISDAAKVPEVGCPPCGHSRWQANSGTDIILLEPGLMGQYSLPHLSRPQQWGDRL